MDPAIEFKSLDDDLDNSSTPLRLHPSRVASLVAFGPVRTNRGCDGNTHGASTRIRSRAAAKSLDRNPSSR